MALAEEYTQENFRGVYVFVFCVCAWDYWFCNEVSGACSAYGGEVIRIEFWWGKPEGKRPLGRPRRRWEDNKMNLQEVGCGGVDWIEVAQDRDRRRALVNEVMDLRVP